MRIINKVSLYLHELIAKNKLTNDKRQEYIDRSQQGSSLEVFPKFVRSDKEIVARSMIKNSPIEQLKFAHKALQSDPVIAKKAIISNAKNIKYVCRSLRDNEDFLIDVAKDEKAEIHLPSISTRLANNENFILQILKIKSNHVLTSLAISKNLVSKIEFMREAVKHSPYVYQYINKNNIKDKELALTVFSNHNFYIFNPNLINFYKTNYSNNLEFNLIVLKQNLNIFKYLSIDLQNNPDVCKNIVLHHDLGKDFLYKDDFSNNKNFIYELIKKNPQDYKDLNNEMKIEARIAKTALILDEKNFAFLPEKLSKNLAFIKLIYKDNPKILNYLSENPFNEYILSDKKFVSLVIPQLKDNQEIFKMINKHHSDDFEIISKSLYINPSCYEYLTTKQRENENYILASMSQKAFKNIRYLPDTIFKNTSNIDKILKNMKDNDFFIPTSNEKDKFHLIRLAYKIFLNNTEYQNIFDILGYSNFMEIQSKSDFDIFSFFNELLTYKLSLNFEKTLST